ncbi:MAG: hypothetical protein GY731_18325, partial [Gammaproteobacteria bacterium]|nr:hypothetical protein [Gammaproteobacteria bacterium]
EGNDGVVEVSLEPVQLEDDAATELGTDPGPYVLFSVADSGIGIPAADREHVFEPFFTTREVGQGTGLGLAMVYGIVTGYRGAVTVDSVPGQGSTFKVYLPRC